MRAPRAKSSSERGAARHLLDGGGDAVLGALGDGLVQAREQGGVPGRHALAHPPVGEGLPGQRDMTQGSAERGAEDAGHVPVAQRLGPGEHVVRDFTSFLGRLVRRGPCWRTQREECTGFVERGPCARNIWRPSRTQRRLPECHLPLDDVIDADARTDKKPRPFTGVHLRGTQRLTDMILGGLRGLSEAAGGPGT